MGIDDNSDLHQRYLQDQTSHYSQRLAEFGSIPQADSWTSKEMSAFYYKKATMLFQDYLHGKAFSSENKLKLLDIGSGNGFYAEYLKESKLLESIDYTGIEINPKSCEAAQAKNLPVNFINDDFAQMKFGFKPFHFITIIGTFSIFDSLSVPETQSYIFNNVEKAFNCCEYGLALLISKFVLDEGSIQKFFSSLTQISSNIHFDTNLFGNYIAVYLYQNKHLTEFYNLSKNNMVNY
jgi:SAM-dependent methyltransferase